MRFEERLLIEIGLGHRHIHERQVGDVTTTVILPEVVVYVDEDGNTVSTETKGVAVATTAPASTPTPSPASTTSSSSSSSSSVAASSNAPVQAYAKSSSTSAAPSSTSSAAAASSSSSSGSAASLGGNIFTSSLRGATYNAYSESGDCLSADEVATQIAQLASEGYNAVRIYAVDCSTVSSVVPAAKKAGMAVLAGLFSLGSLSSDLESMSQQLNGDFSYISAISVGNELIQSGSASASQIVDAIGTVKSFLGNTNFKGGVTSVDTFDELLNSANSAVIDAVDFVAANCHAIFDSEIVPSGAGDYVQTACIDPLTKIAGGKPVVITESGWACQNPSGGIVSSIINKVGQATAAEQLRSKPLFFFSPYSTIWQGTGNINGYFGLGTNC